MRWQRAARIVVAIIGLGAAVAIYYSSRSRPKQADPPKSLATIDANTVQTTGACGFRFIRPGKADARVTCERSETKKDGRQVLYGAEVTGLEGSKFSIRSDVLETTGQATAQGFPSHYVLTGHVVITTDDGLRLEAEQATYDDTTGQLAIPGPVAYTKGRLSGHAVGGTYDRTLDAIALLDQATARVAPDATGRGAADATSTRMNLMRGQHMLRLEGQARVVGDTQTMTGDNATFTFTEDESAVKYVELRGAARVTPNKRGSTDQPGMSADNITMTFQPDGLTLQHATLTGQANLEMAGASSRRIQASWIDFVLAPDGRTVTGLRAKDRLTVTLAATQTAAARTITAETLSATGDDKKGLTLAQFDGNPIFRQDPAPARGTGPAPATSNSRKGSATRLVLTLGGQLDAIQFAEFQQNAKFDDGDVRGAADIARYDEANQLLHLIANARDPRRKSTVTTPDMAVDAWTIDVGTESQNLNAKGGVLTRALQSTSTAASSGALFGGKEDILGAAESFVYTKSSRLARYSGTTALPAKLWQGASQVQAEEIDFLDGSRSLNARRKVDSTWLLEPAAGDKAGTPLKSYRVRADTLEYDEARRTADYKGQTVFLNSSDGDVEARTMTFRLAAAARTLEEMRASQDVYAQLSGGYEAVGETLIFHADTDTYTLTGKGATAQLKAPKQTDTPASPGADCTLTESMQIDLNRKTNKVQLPGSGEAPKPSKPIACSDSLRRPK